MYKHALMLTVATVALTAGSAAFADTTITTTEKSAQTTSTDGNIILGTTTTGSSGSTTVTNGNITVTIANPAVTIDSANYVQINTAASTISNTGTSGAIGIQLDATAAGGNGITGTNGPNSTNDAIYSIGKIDLTGSGTNKTGIYVFNSDSSTSPSFNGNIDLANGSTLSVTGDGSTAIKLSTGTQLNGDVKILGSVLVNPTTAGATSGGAVTGMRIDGTLNGSIYLGTAGTLDANGAAANGIVITGEVKGDIENNGAISALGTSTASSTTANPEASSALIIAASVDGGIYNAGPVSTSSTTARSGITTYGNAPAISIATGSAGAAAVPITIGDGGAYQNVNGMSYGIVNRGTITAHPYDADLNGTVAINTSGGSGDQVTIQGGIYNSGSIAASAAATAKAGTIIGAEGIAIGNYVTVPTLVNNSAESGGGTISASVSGAYSAAADAIFINQFGSLTSLTNSGTITASATSTDTTVSSLSAFAIQDVSGTLKTITNTGTISATTSTLDNNYQVAVALALGNNTSGVTLTNQGTIAGDVQLGAGSDIVSLSGTSTQAASITGNISFGGGNDTLTIGDYSTVTGALTERGGGTVAVTVGNGTGTGTLTLTNTTSNLQVSSLNVTSGGTLGMAVSQYFNSTSASYVGPVVTSTGAINLDTNSKFNLTFQSFVSTPNVGQKADFVLLDAPASQLTVGNFATIKNTVEGNATNGIAGQIPYLYTGDICTYNVSATSNCTDAPTTTDSQLVLQLTPKTATQIGLTGNAKNIFTYANAALATDNKLGAALVTDVTNATQAQAAYEGFVPDVSGSSRAVLISITDQATGPVAARQRALRTYANMDGDTTLWGQQFFQRMDSASNADGYRGSGFGFALGADSGSPQAGRYGLALTFFSGDQTNKTSNFQKISNQWYLLTGYTDWRGKGLFLDTQLSFGYGVLNGRRYIKLTDPNNSANVFTREAQSKRAGLTLAGGFTTGAVLTYGGTVITPQMSLDGLTMREERYTENGGGSGVTGQDGLDLTVQPYYANSARGYLGTSVRQDIEFDGFYVQPELRAGYRYDFLAQAVKLKAAFASQVGLPNSQFTITGPDPEKGNLVAGGSLSVSTGTWSLGVNYDYLRGTHGATDQIGTITILGRI